MAGIEDKSERCLYVKTPTDNFVLYGRPCELSAFSFIPGDRHLPQDRTWYNVEKKERFPKGQFDRQFLRDFGWNQKLHRDDRAFARARGLLINQEDASKTVPSLSSSRHGHRWDKPLEGVGNKSKYVRIGYVATEFYRRNGANLEPLKDENTVKKIQ